MPFMVWNDRLSVDVEGIDGDHRKLVDMVNELYDAILAGTGRKKLEVLLDRLVDYTRYHLAREEELFARTQYPDAETHKREHDELRKWMKTARRRFHTIAMPAPSLEVMVYLKDWLFGHILGSDQKYVSHFKSHQVL